MSHSQHDWPLVHGHCVPCLLEKEEAATREIEKLKREAREIKAKDVLKKLQQMAGPHTPECVGQYCRHSKVLESIFQVGDALARIEFESKRCPECKGGGEIGLADGDVPCPTCGGSGDDKNPGCFAVAKKVAKP